MLATILLALVVGGVFSAADHAPIGAQGMSAVPTSEVKALQSIYNDARGNLWSWRLPYSVFGNPWNFSNGINSNPCLDNWQGVVCSAASNIVQITLVDYQLSGFLSPDISQLTLLENLTITDNVELVGTIPPSIGQLSQLRHLNFGGNQFTGHIPPEIGQLAKLQYLELYSLPLTGSIPPEIGRLTQLQFLALGQSFLSGTIPSEIGKLTLLQDLYIQYSMVSGTLPKEIGELSSLQFLFIQYNHLTGSIPSSVGEMFELETFVVASNIFNSSIPAQFSKLLKLQSLDVKYNQLTGTLPAELYNMESLINLLVSHNSITGTIAIEVGQTAQLQYLDISANLLTGTIPLSIGQLTQLLNFNVGKNQLHGNIPTEVGNMSSLLTFDIDNNFFTGKIIPELFQLSLLQTLFLDNNQLTGSLLPDLGLLLGLQFFDVYRNRLTGRIPREIGRMVQLLYMDIGVNFLSNSIPYEIASLSKFQIVDMQSNIISGTVPERLWNLPSLLEIVLSQNSLSGTLVSLTKNSSLSVYDVSDNRFVGTLPTFENTSSVTMIYAGGNCMRGTLLESYCSNKRLVAIALSGLNNGRSCANELRGLQSSLGRKPGLIGTVPSCYFDLPVLQTLSLSGNGLTGKLPKVSRNPSVISDMSLSHNRFSGSIPDWVWSNPRWKVLDLSFNRFTGNFPSNMSFGDVNASLSLVINHLSGNIPPAFKTVKAINILEGNIFSCPPDRGTIPSHDPHYSSYSCGSDTVNSGFIVWIVLVCPILFAAWYASRGKPSLLSNDSTPLLQPQRIVNGSISFASDVVSVFKLIVIFVVPILIVVCLPFYAVMSVYYGVYETQYAWTVSACYLSGATPAVLMLIMFLLVLGVSQFLLAQRTDRTGFGPDTTPNRETVTTSTFSKIKWCAQFFVVACMVGIVLLVNGAYVLTLTSNINLSLLALSTLLLSLFKILCGLFVIHRMNWLLMCTLKIILPQASSRDLLRTQENAFGVQITTSLTIFNNVMAPYLAEMFVNGNCFLYVWTQAPSVTTQFTINNTCSEENLCELFVEDSFTFRPIFTYNYLCSSSLITSFAFVFVLRFVLSAMVQLGCILLAYYVDIRHRHRSVDDSSWPQSADCITRFIWSVLPYRFRPLQWYSDQYALDREDQFPMATEESPLQQPIRADDCQSDLSVFFDKSAQPLSSSVEVFRLSMLLPTRREVAVTLVSDVTLLCTYGLLFPPLGLIIAFGMGIQLYLLIHFHWYRLSTLVVDRPYLQPEMTAIHDDFAQIGRSIYPALSRVTYLVSFFWSFTLFDTLGATVGALHSAWIVIVTCTAPLWLGFLLGRLPSVLVCKTWCRCFLPHVYEWHTSTDQTSELVST